MTDKQTNRQTNKHTDISTYRKNRPRGPILQKSVVLSYLEGVLLFRVEPVAGLDDQSETLGPAGVALSSIPLLQASSPLLHSRRVHSETGGQVG